MSQQNYVEILIKSLEKKQEVLKGIQEQNDIQSRLLAAETFDDSAFDETIEKKDRFIKDLQLIDMGFDSVYTRVKEELKVNKSAYANEIKRMQELITMVTEQSTSIQATEQRNDVALKNRFRSERARIRQSRTSVKAVTGYYQSANTYSAQNNSQYMDWKQ